MDFGEAALTVLREEGVALHWTVIQDLALKRGYLDPFTQPDVRKNVLAALARAAKQGLIERQGTGTYVIASTKEEAQ